ncbi:hypothetical protein SCHPADRAFT_1002475 [Schizopora paradoxa]|uniref:MYND-type domain-containing protein n=1 Tax=Schizopora paradoxa TaxID=27342 RepID=A0A0H2R345_9AGAM|nr:hypothetical protein SCHPADRAFT_1002475 [Schizopora paradoxa]
MKGWKRPVQPRKKSVEEIVKDAKAGTFGSLQNLAGAIDGRDKFPDKLYPEIFKICCHYAKIRRSLSQDTVYHLSELRTGVDLIITSLWMIGSYPMRNAIRENEAAFTPLLREQWAYVVLAIMDVFEICKFSQDKTAVEMPSARLDMLCILCDAMSTLFVTKVLCEHIDTPKAQILLEFTWILWLSGGPRDFKAKSSNEFNFSAGRCISNVVENFDQKLAFGAASKGSRMYGGIPSIAKIALSAFKCSVSEGHAKASWQAIPFLIFSPTHERHTNEFLKAICNSDGIPKLTIDLVRLANNFRWASWRCMFFISGADPIMLAILNIILRSPRDVEQAVRNGLLEVFLILNSKQSDVNPPETVRLITEILENLPQYFVYYSVVKAFSEAMQKITDGYEVWHWEEKISKGETQLAEAWRQLKRLLAESCCLMRFFDLVVFPNLKTKYCNSCGETLGDSDLLTCKCKRVHYCSEQCRATNLKDDGHCEDCHQGVDRFDKDMPFLCFLANLYISTRSTELLDNSLGAQQITVADASFQAFFISPKPILSAAHVSVAEHGLQINLESHSRNGIQIKTRSRASRKQTDDAGFDGKIGSNIEIAVVVRGPDGALIVRRISYDPDPRVNFRCGAKDLESAYFSKAGHFRRSFLNYRGSPLDESKGRDIVDNVISMFYTPDGDPWTCHLRDNSKPKEHDADDHNKSMDTWVRNLSKKPKDLEATHGDVMSILSKMNLSKLGINPNPRRLRIDNNGKEAKHLLDVIDDCIRRIDGLGFEGNM